MFFKKLLYFEIYGELQHPTKETRINRSEKILWNKLQKVFQIIFRIQQDKNIFVSFSGQRCSGSLRYLIVCTRRFPGVEVFFCRNYSKSLLLSWRKISLILAYSLVLQEARVTIGIYMYYWWILLCKETSGDQ